MIRGAGILFLAKDGKALFLLRGNGGDAPNTWCFPGGHVEDGETAEQAAERETIEEIGFLPEGKREAHTRTRRDRVAAVGMVAAPTGVGVASLPASAPEPEKVDFTTFIQRVPETFEPKLDAEHIGYCWAPGANPPQPLHPGCQIALSRLTMDELGVARAIASGQLTSPQRYLNVFLFAIRITGTGVAYRRALVKGKKVIRPEEFAFRNPAIYLNDEFLARICGLPVIFEHPKKTLLDSKEFNDRIVGAVFLPYIRDNEVWAVCRIYDDDAIAIMSNSDMSTSPSVVLKGNGGTKIEVDGENVLIENEAELVDHIAIVAQGVWDKSGEPAGVDVDGIIVIADSASAQSVLARSKLDRALFNSGSLDWRFASLQ